MPDGLPKNEMECRGKVNLVPKNARGRVFANSDRRVPYETGLARRCGVGAKGALFLLAARMAQGLPQHQTTDHDKKAKIDVLLSGVRLLELHLHVVVQGVSVVSKTE